MLIRTRITTIKFFNSENPFISWMLRAVLGLTVTIFLYILWHLFFSQINYSWTPNWLKHPLWFKLLKYDEPFEFVKYLFIVTAAVITAYFTGQRVHENYKQNKLGDLNRQDDLFIRSIELLGDSNVAKQRSGVAVLCSLCTMNPENTQRCLDILLGINQRWMKDLAEQNLLNNQWYDHPSIESFLKKESQEAQNSKTPTAESQILKDLVHVNEVNCSEAFQLSKIIRRELPKIFRYVSTEVYFKEDRLILFKAYLCGFDFSGLQLNNHFDINNSIFNGSDFENSSFENEITLTSNTFTACNFNLADLQSCHFKFCNFYGSDLRFIAVKGEIGKNIFDACIIDEQDKQHILSSKFEGTFYIQQYGNDKKEKVYDKGATFVDYSHAQTRWGQETFKIKRWIGASGFIKKRLDEFGKIQIYTRDNQ